ncbi:uncharacterized protein LOC110445917 isoform X2 [Mizuhopecten yessoensis]|uniref:uncharacterized protein LOC110445917 isoform X2 n=1 Tax=Mizuhopecten yessoensis TaxID=6573 RepID=UPI000B457FF2|nr:uncharacterized protein LOC110445917 isoform X2 [Mizuhopecten yessoensis]
MDHSEPSSSGMNGAVPKTKKRKSDEVKLSSSQRSMNWRQQQKELDPEGFREKERLRTRERRQNRQRNQTKCSTNMSSKETQTDITVSVNEILWKLTPLSDFSGRYKLVDQMDGTGNVDLIFEENDKAVMNTRKAGIQETHSFVTATTSSHRQRGDRQCVDNSDLAEMSPLSLPSDISDIDPDQFNDILQIVSSEKIHASSHDVITECKASKISELQTPVETVGRSIENNPADGNPNDVDAISKQFDDMETAFSSQIPSIRDTKTSTDPCPDVVTRGQKQTIPLSDGNSIESSNAYQNIFQTIAEQEIPISPHLSVTSLILDMQQDMTKTVPRPYSVESICSDAEMPSSKKILVTSNDDTTECTGGDIQHNGGSKSDTVAILESQMPLETVGNSNEDSPPAGNPNAVYAISIPFDDMETASSSQASIRNSTDPRPEVTTRDINCNGERGNADGKKDKELKAPYKKSGAFTFYSSVSKTSKTVKRAIVNMLTFKDKIYFRMEDMKFIEEVSANGKVESLITFENVVKDRVVLHVAISQTNGAVWFCCDDNSVNKYLAGKCTEKFRTKYPPKHLYIYSSNLKEEAYVSHETGLEIWDEDRVKCIHLYIDSTDSNGEKELFYPSTIDKDAVSGRVLVTSLQVYAPMLLDGSLQKTTFIETLPEVCPRFRIFTGCFNHKGNIILGTSSGVYVLSGVNFEVLTILNKHYPTFNMLCFPNNDLWIVYLRDICKYSYTDE